MILVLGASELWELQKNGMQNVLDFNISWPRSFGTPEVWGSGSSDCQDSRTSVFQDSQSSSSFHVLESLASVRDEVRRRRSVAEVLEDVMLRTCF